MSQIHIKNQPLVDANNLIQTVNYISDSLGFRVAATNLPVAPATEEQKESYWALVNE